MFRSESALLLGWLVLAAVPMQAQSLGEVAKKEAARRAEVGEAGRVYTNEDLIPDARMSAPAPEPVTAVSPASVSAVPGTAPDPVAASLESMEDPAGDGVTPRALQEPQPPSDKNESYWRGRARNIRARIAAQQAQIDALRARLASFSSGSPDPEREITAKAFADAQADLVSINQEWVRFEAQARSEKVPDAWIR